jgi:predicted secreted hydrolase
MRKTRTTATRAAIGAVAAALVAGTGVLAVPAVAQAGTGPAKPAAAPTHLVHLPADQAAHAGAANEWWYVVGHLHSHGHLFGYEIQLIAQTNAGADGAATPPETEIAITDQTTGQYYTQTSAYDPSQTSFSTTTLNESEPTASLSGPMNAMHLHATMPAGTIDVTLDALGPVLYNYGTGVMPYLGGSSFYYSLPSAATTGTLVENGHSYPVTGQSWVDHQWGSWDWSTLQKYTWMSLQLSDGDRVDLFDSFVSGTENSFATVLHPDGTEQVVSVDPLAPSTSDFWTSPNTGQRFGTRWVVRIPSLNASLIVRAHPQQQEVLDAGGIFEGASTVAGTSGGHVVTGQAYAEQLGDWQP